MHVLNQKQPSQGEVVSTPLTNILCATDCSLGRLNRGANLSWNVGYCAQAH